MCILQLCDYTTFATYASSISGLRPLLFHNLPLKDKTSLSDTYFSISISN